MKIRPVGAEVFHADGRTDMAKIIVTFRHFANPSKDRGTIDSPSASVLTWKYEWTVTDHTVCCIQYQWTVTDHTVCCIQYQWTVTDHTVYSISYITYDAFGGVAEISSNFPCHTYTVHSVHYDILKLCWHQQLHNSTIFCLLLMPYLLRLPEDDDNAETCGS